MTDKIDMMKVMNEYDKANEKYSAIPIKIWIPLLTLASIGLILKYTGFVETVYLNYSYVVLIFGSLHLGYIYTKREGYCEGFMDGVNWKE